MTSVNNSLHFFELLEGESENIDGNSTIFHNEIY